MDEKRTTVDDLKMEIKHLKRLLTITTWFSIAVTFFVLTLSLKYTNSRFNDTQEIIRVLTSNNAQIIEIIETISDIQYQHFYLNH